MKANHKKSAETLSNAASAEAAPAPKAQGVETVKSGRTDATPKDEAAENKPSTAADAKAPVAESAAAGGQAAGEAKPYLGDQAVHDAIAGYCRRSALRRKGSFEAALEDGADLDRTIKVIEGGKFDHLAKRPNGQDVYVIVERFPDSRVNAKQLRRIHHFFNEVAKTRAAGKEPVQLGVTFYDIVRRLPTVEMRHEALLRAERDGLCAREFIMVLDKMHAGGHRQKKAASWRKVLGTLTKGALEKLEAVDEAMAKNKAVLNAGEVMSLQKLRAAIDMVLKRARK